MTPQEFQRQLTRPLQRALVQPINIGSTGNRPVSPQPGTRYIDNTLKPNGLVIYWNPPNWIDSQGNIV